MTKKTIKIDELTIHSDVWKSSTKEEKYTFCDNVPAFWPVEWSTIVDEVLNSQFKLLQRKFTSLGSNTESVQEQEAGILSLQLFDRVIQKLYPLWYIVGVQSMSHPTTIGYVLRMRNQDRAANDSSSTVQTIEIVRTATSRKTSIQFREIMVENLRSYHNQDMMYEITNAIGLETLTEIVSELLNELLTISGSVLSSVIPSDTLSLIDTIMTSFFISAAQIEQATRRGKANFIVVSPVLAAVIQNRINESTIYQLEYKPVITSGILSPTPICHAGDIWMKQSREGGGEQMRVCRVFTTVVDGFVNGNDYTVLVGYKGLTSVDAGAVYSPYQLLVQPMMFDVLSGERVGGVILQHNKWADVDTDKKNPYYVSYKVSMRE